MTLRVQKIYEAYNFSTFFLPGTLDEEFRRFLGAFGVKEAHMHKLHALPLEYGEQPCFRLDFDPPEESPDSTTVLLEKTVRELLAASIRYRLDRIKEYAGVYQKKGNPNLVTIISAESLRLIYLTHWRQTLQQTAEGRISLFCHLSCPPYPAPGKTYPNYPILGDPFDLLIFPTLIDAVTQTWVEAREYSPRSDQYKRQMLQSNLFDTLVRNRLRITHHA